MPSDKIYILEYDGITIHLTPASLQNRSFHLGSESSRTKVHHTTTIPTKGQNCISYQHLCRSLLIRCSSPHPSTKATNGTIDIAIHTKELCHPHTDLQPLSQGTLLFLLLLLQSIAVPRAIKLHPSRGAPNDVDVLSRSRRSICHAHVMIAVAARLRLISPIPSLLNHRE